jgi:modulator of FtsH protease HflK
VSVLSPEPAVLDHAPAEPLPARPGRPLLSSGRAVGIFALAWFLSGTYFVRTDQQAVVTRFGAVTAPRVYPGVHYALPWPIDRVYKVKVNQLQRLVIGADAADGALGLESPFASQFLTGDKNIINMRVVVQYSVAVPADYLFRSADVPACVTSSVEAELTRRIARREVDAVLTTEKLAIQDEVLAAAQERLNDYSTGVRLSTINIESVSPPAETADAFRDVASARADTARIIDEAHGYANDLVPRARGEGKQMTEAAEAYKQSRINEAKGDAARFNALAAEYAKAAEVTSRRLYLEAMEQVLPKIRKLIVDGNGKVDLSIIRKGDPQPAAPKP